MHPLHAELNPICHLLALLGGATIVVVSRLRVKVRVHRPQLEGAQGENSCEEIHAAESDVTVTVSD